MTTAHRGDAAGPIDADAGRPGEPGESRAGGERGLLAAVAADGRPLLHFVAFALLFAGCFALFVSLRREFLPHDIAYLGMTPDQLCAIGECRVVAFMVHDAEAFGGALVATAVPYP